MSTSSTTDAQPPVAKKDNAVKVSLASMIGTVVESYDFFIYATASATYFGAVFFATDDPLVGALASFATLAIGFLFRPLGGYLAGHFGDRIGRKRVLIWSLVVMGVVTTLIGVLPTFATIGIAAPIMLILLRVIQGVAYGAEWGGAVLMAVEHAPTHRRGFFGALPQIGIPGGLLVANGTILATSGLPGDWAWRVPFLLASVMVIIGLFIRLKVAESPAFEQAKEQGELLKQPALETLKQDWRVIVRIIGLRLAETGGYYVTTAFTVTYVGLASITAGSNVLIGTLVGSALGLGSHLLFGALSDRIGRKKVFLIGSVFTILFGIPMFLLINTGSLVMIVIAIALSLLLSHDPIFAVESSWFSELFPANRRTSGISLGYNGAAIIAGFLPFIATAAYGWMGWMGPALLLTLLGVISTLTAITARETAPAVVGASAAASDTRIAERVSA
ncbi:MHS family shikimate/dehydroshikimate transporter-like MFS transporter [Agrococcus sp. UYP10]|uniref:Putative MFS family arabinose efflux permease n=1 Tax=Agrococcus jenensis TaxID=46353 RepID=A0A3N2ARS1_9MICO|nr:MFS transporter [Agrococcus jenensis]ROR65747.1 putative MFS family arabinose efflux permease [Agrococcus jenensis]